MESKNYGTICVFCASLILFALIVFMSISLAGCPAAIDQPNPTPPPTTSLTVYDESLSSGWQDWSWDTTVSLASTNYVKNGSFSLSAEYTNLWGGLYLNVTPDIDMSGYDTVEFWIHGGASGGQSIRIHFKDGSGTDTTDVVLTPPTASWSQVSVPVSDMGNPASISGIVFQDNTGGAQPAFYLDDIKLTGISPTPGPPGAGPSLSVDVSAGRHAISPYIYGMNFADEPLADELDLPVRRFGGNSATTYNWRFDIHNTGADWYFENVPDTNPNPTILPNGSSVDRFVDQDRRTGTKSLLTIPMIEWSPKENVIRDHPYEHSFSILKYGTQEANDWEWEPDAGNGILIATGLPITGNDPTDAYYAIDTVFVSDWIDHLKGLYDTASNGGVMFYNLDNEPMLWNSTHRDIHPNPVTYDEIYAKTVQYAEVLKGLDPSAKTLGPVVWGWCAYFYSAADGCNAGSDRAAHGNMDFIPWYLQAMQTYETDNSLRLLDYLDVHIYPQGYNYADPLGSQAIQDLRLRSTRGFWDPSYVDESWIGQAIRLIPRIKSWVDTYYPGTKLAITEYNWGALEYMNGALAQADILGIFGREGLDLATIWGPPASSDPGAYAFRMYLNYNGAGNTFGDTSVQAASGDQGKLAIYASQRTSDNALTLMVINKTGGGLTSTISIAGFTAVANASVYRYSDANLGAIAHEADVPVSGGSITETYPANSITLLVVPEA